MKIEKALLLFIILCLVWLAVGYGSHISDIDLHHPERGTTALGYQVLGLRCAFLFFAFLSSLVLCGNYPEQKS